ncbi:MAG: peroxidase family protein, partial [Xenococcus sp. (in: cyanobacteria)]
NPSISNEFSTAAFRFGHTMLSPQLLRVDGPGKPDKVEEIPLQDAFFDPDEIYNNGIDSLLRGLSHQKAQEIDNKLVDDVRNFLFGFPGEGGLDLASLNIQRGREHGLPDFNTVRAQMGFHKYSNFDELTGQNHTLSKQLADVYGSVDQVDLWVGGLAEQQAPGALVGETFQKIIADQFTRLRDGDRFWYGSDHYLKPFDDLIDINYTLSAVIKDNSSFTDIHKNAFLVSHTVDATVI